MWTDVRYTRSPRCCPCSPHSLYYLYTAWHQFRNALYWFCIANPSGDPFSFASWRVWAGGANTQTHLVQSVSVSDLLHTYKEQHTHTDTGQYVHCEKMYNMYMQTTLKKQEFPYTYIYKGSSFSAHFLQCIPLCFSSAEHKPSGFENMTNTHTNTHTNSKRPSKEGICYFILTPPLCARRVGEVN